MQRSSVRTPEGAVVVAAACLQGGQPQQAGHMAGVCTECLPPQPPRRPLPLPVCLRTLIVHSEIGCGGLLVPNT